MKTISSRRALFLGLLAFLLAACAPVAVNPAPAAGQDASPSAAAATPTALPPGATATPAPSSTTPASSPALPATATSLPAEPPGPLVFAVIGDYGMAGPASADVAALVRSWSPELILTTGDNNYPIGAAETIDENVGQFYSGYMHPYDGRFGSGAAENRFFPTLGNHDWDSDRAAAFLAYFTLPGEERYYDFAWGPVHFFALDTDSREPDGVGASSAQAAWLQERLATAEEPWKVVYGHHPPYSSGTHGPVDWMRWPFRDWGADVYIAGHDHLYERLEVDGFPYVINGLGGHLRYDFTQPLPGSLVRYNADYGALRVEATEEALLFQFISRAGELVDSWRLTND